ncbi:response regulator [Rufibacter hautae]|uniref:Response regulator n=1 Tax=Rufibacter hautae TaxID=2595005 RepID=A0A5B6TE49_9BACT|nr:response regulator [Rufibacter hautae]KAA3437510.1 response regulator [Rufibacter hautae]
MQEQHAADAQADNAQKMLSVMIVDDDESWIFVSKLLLKKAGIQNGIITAKNGLEAFTKLQELVSAEDKKLPDLIFLDIRMPVMDGFEFLERTTKTDPIDLSQTKVYICSSSLNPGDKEKAALYPVAGFLTKPLSKEILQGIIG